MFILKEVLRYCKGAANIADDVTVHERGVNLFVVLNRLEECGLTPNGSKCKFRFPRLTFYGHGLGKQRITPSEEKIDAILNAKYPKNASEVRSFLGLVQYFAKFLPNFAEVDEPLRILTRKDQKFTWGEDQEEAFRELKKLMTSAETLAYFKNDCKTRVVADQQVSEQF